MTSKSAGGAPRRTDLAGFPSQQLRQDALGCKHSVYQSPSQGVGWGVRKRNPTPALGEAGRRHACPHLRDHKAGSERRGHLPTDTHSFFDRCLLNTYYGSGDTSE